MGLQKSVSRTNRPSDILNMSIVSNGSGGKASFSAHNDGLLIKLKQQEKFRELNQLD